MPQEKAALSDHSNNAERW